MRAHRAQYPDKPAVQVEIGNFLQALGPDRSVKNKWLLEGLRLQGTNLLNVGEDDIAELLALGVDLKKDGRFLSANLLSRQTGEPLLAPFTIKLMPIPGTEKKLRLGFLGLSAREATLSSPEPPYLWADPLATAAKWIPILRQQCDFLVVIACMPSRDAVQLAINQKDVDIIVTGYKHQYFSPMATINQAKILYADDEGKILGEIRFIVKRGENIQASTLEHILTSNIKDDPEMLAFVNRAKPEIAAAQNQIARNTAAPPILGNPAPSRFLTAQNCASCHAREHSVWAGSKHAHAMDPLTRVKKEFDSSCVACHVTGSGQPEGFVDLYKTPILANVQCEACHGAGREHAQNPTSAKMKTLGRTSCLSCHTKSNSPEFQFDPYWKKIAH